MWYNSSKHFVLWVIAMYLRKAFNKKTGRTYLSIVHGYRDEAGKTKSKVIKSVGYLDVLEKTYDDPIAHFTKLAKEMDAQRLENEMINLSFNLNETLELNATNRKNYGHLVASHIYHELEIDRFLDNARRHTNFKFNSEAIMRLLVYARLLYPSSKHHAYHIKDQFIDKYDFSLDDVYHCLDHFNDISVELQNHLHSMVCKKYERKTDLVYYDVTNYYFETECQDELRKNGFSKEGKRKPIVQMGLFLDTKGLPITYKLFEGNTHDSQTMMPMITELKKRFKIGRIIIVADKALNSGDNIAYNTILKNGYIFSKSIRGASAEFKEWVLDQDGYYHTDKKLKLKSQIIHNSKVKVTLEKEGKKKKTKTVEVPQKFIVFYSEKYAKRAKHKREEVIAKAVSLIENPSKYDRVLDYGAAGYVLNFDVDEKTGELKEKSEKLLILDEDRIKEEEELDGYYAIVTSELDTDDTSIIEQYRGLWKIEESFKITKSTLRTRPIYHRLVDRINAHFLVCFISLLIGRIIEMHLDGKYTIGKIAKTLQNISCSRLDQNYWLFDHRCEVTDALNNEFGTDFGFKVMTTKKIKENFAISKK